MSPRPRWEVLVFQKVGWCLGHFGPTSEVQGPRLRGGQGCDGSADRVVREVRRWTLAEQDKLACSAALLAVHAW